MFNEGVDDLRSSVKNSFRNIKIDIDKLRDVSAANSQTIKELIKQNQELREMVKTLTKTLNEVFLNQKGSRLNSDMFSKIKRNTREIIKSRILELVQTEKYGLSEVRDILVKKDKYCSKATFYRYTTELKHEIEEISIQGKSIVIPIKR
ncbi:MAG: hypothetical protein KKA51_02010 [Nanoarchaeota archaeon]|nr:hypothetical protein [Nanoarchaeota archaeon]